MKPTPDPNDAELERLLQGLGQLQSAPDDVLRRAIDVWVAPPPPILQQTLRRVLAVLSFDSAGASALAFGRRSGGAADRQLLFSVEGRDIDLRVAPVTGSRGALWTLSGQVLGPDLDAEVVLRVDAHESRVALNELAEFRFDGVPQGECHLALHAADGVIELPPIRIPPAG